MVMMTARSCQVSWIDFNDGQIELPTNLELISVNCCRRLMRMTMVIGDTSYYELNHEYDLMSYYRPAI